jgi:hypothetical protein
MPPEVATPTTIKHFPEKLPQGPSNRNQNVAKEKMTFIRPHPNCNAVFFRPRGKFDDKLGAISRSPRCSDILADYRDTFSRKHNH